MDEMFTLSAVTLTRTIRALRYAHGRSSVVVMGAFTMGGWSTYGGAVRATVRPLQSNPQRLVGACTVLQIPHADVAESCSIYV